MIKIIEADITRLELDAIVNAANSTLSGGGGVDGAIHRAAGPNLKAACSRLGGCPTGEAVITEGYDLPAKFVIHTVGPIWGGGHNNEKELLSSCYRKSLMLVSENALKSVAFPAISCGVYGYPVNKASKVAVNTIIDVIEQNGLSLEVKLVCFSPEVSQALTDAYLHRMRSLPGTRS